MDSGPAPRAEVLRALCSPRVPPAVQEALGHVLGEATATLHARADTAAVTRGQGSGAGGS